MEREHEDSRGRLLAGEWRPGKERLMSQIGSPASGLLRGARQLARGKGEKGTEGGTEGIELLLPFPFLISAVAGAVWTGTTAGGVSVSGSTCNDWSGGGSGAIGDTGKSDSEWTLRSFVDSDCAGTAHLYCFADHAWIFGSGFEDDAAS
jgi:hypothetical protein